MNEHEAAEKRGELYDELSTLCAGLGKLSELDVTKLDGLVEKHGLDEVLAMLDVLIEDEKAAEAQRELDRKAELRKLADDPKAFADYFGRKIAGVTLHGFRTRRK